MRVSLPRDPHRIALLSDVHIAGNPGKCERGINLADHVRRAVQDLLAPIDGTLPGRVIINGDCAHHRGRRCDYVHAGILLRPIVQAGIPLHIGMGNHDCREGFAERFNVSGIGGEIAPVEGRTVLEVPTPDADIIVLDSLDKTAATPGRLGQRQLHWLERTLDTREPSGRPLVILMHHNPEIALQVETRPGLGLDATETSALLAILKPRRQVKALLWGHLHRWEHGTVEGMHLVCLPAVAFAFRPEQPSAWVDCRLTPSGATLTLRCISPAHPRHGEILHLPWRR